MYPKQVGEEAARRAFAAAINARADAEAIIAGAKAYAVARQGEPERYTMNPANWLRDGRWKDAAPAGAVIDEQGNVVAVEQPSDDGRQHGIVWVAEQLIRQAEEEGGGW